MAGASAAAEQWGELLPELVRRGSTVATAESLTGGQLAAALTAVPGSSAVYMGGVVSYATAVKASVLGVPAELIAEHGVVSAACAAAMATGVRDLLMTTYAVSTTGVAGPEGQDGQPVGTVHIGVAGPAGVTTTGLALAGDRAAVRDSTVVAALWALAAMIYSG